MRNIFKEIHETPAKLMYGLERLGLLGWMKDSTYLKKTYKLAFGRKLDLDDPKCFTEKINWYKLYYRDPLMSKCADKYAVREYIEEKIGSKYLTTLYGVWDNFEEIDFDALPDEFVLKATNGSGDVYVCKDKNKLDKEKARKVLTKYQNKNFSGRTKEWAYYGLPYKIIAESLIHSTDGKAIKDYKFFCFEGEPKFLFVGTDRDTEVKFDFFDTDWNWIDVRNGHENNPDRPKRPEHLEEMLDVARKLSADFPHVRVDLYEEEGKVYFGELTFYHFGGFTKFEPESYDYEFGKYFNVESIKNNYSGL